MLAWLSALRSLPVIGLLVGLFVGLSCVGLRSTGSLQPLELALYDSLLRLRSVEAKPDPRIVLIAITEKDMQGRWPVSDATLADALASLLRAHPRVVGMDLYRDVPVQPGHAALRSLLASHREVIGVWKVGGEGRPTIPPSPILKGTDRIGFSDIVLDTDGIVRRGLLYADVDKQVVPAFALQVALRYLETDGIVPHPDPVHDRHLRLGPTTLAPFEASDGGYVNADARGYQILLDYRTARAKPATFTLSALLAGQVKPAEVNDKIVLIGTEAESIPDVITTPIHVSGHESVSGVNLHAQFVSQLLRIALDRQAPMKTTSEKQEIFGTLFWGLLGGFIGLWVRSPWRFVVVAAGGLLVLGAGTSVAFLGDFWIPAGQLALAWVCSSSLATAAVLNQERRQRGELMQLFSRHVSSEVADAIWRKRDQFLDGGRPRPQKMIATVLFSDLKGYTTLAEQMPPQTLMDWMNSYLETMAQVISQHGGIVDDYAGDGIKANFGVPVPRLTEETIAREAVNAVRCALAMEAALQRLNSRWQAEALPTVGMRIGICTGPVVAGSLGSAQRLKYTTIGDTVNSAARLEGLGKDLVGSENSENRCRILIDETTARYLGTQFQKGQVGEVSVKGKEQPIMAYRILGYAETADDRL